ncbi:30S ribosomal protein S6e [Candidatus Bathyarchaeota archaeon]|nr:30S ribosomal protein S6e [Candidatus Bathyarchaeota archaeon]MBS7613350.1 30S ribosomal protein S6e [Candidatus Bathyarchaeota archaeon]MBS7618176.1 30S ribosomal protein S6e [Candidatus Bathyarchaeota archaeon]
MAKFKLIISNPKTGKSKTFEVEGAQAVPLLGRRIGEIVDGSTMGLGKVKLLVTGGSDKDGIPMRPEVRGAVKKYVLISNGPGFKPKREGIRIRKLVRGNTITEDTLQVNLKVVEGDPGF